MLEEFKDFRINFTKKEPYEYVLSENANGKTCIRLFLYNYIKKNRDKD